MCVFPIGSLLYEIFYILLYLIISKSFFKLKSVQMVKSVHLLSNTHFHSCFFLTFPFILYFYTKFKLSVNAYLLLIYTFMCMIMLFLGFKPISTLVLTQGNAMLHIFVFNEVQDTTKVSQIILLRIILLSFQSHQIRILSAGLGMAWNRDGLS